MNEYTFNKMNNTLLARITKHFIRKFLRSSYPNADQSFAIRILILS